MSATALNWEANPSVSEVIAALETATRRPDDALRAGVGLAGEIAPAVIHMLDKATVDPALLEPEANLLFWGIHVLAAARRTELYRPLLRFLRARSGDELERLLGDATTESLASIMISVFDGDPQPLLDACADRGVDEFARWNLICALARLTFDGAVSRETTLAFLDRFDREPLADPEDNAWQGWQDAICLLGLEEMRERLCAACREGRFVQPDGELEFCLSELAVARSLAPGDDGLFVRAGHAPIGDPVAALDWISNDGNDASGANDFDVPDPASEFALNEEEIDSLLRFIAGRPAAADVMSLETIDGYYSALAMDPDWNRAKQAAASIFGSPDEALYFDSDEQAEHIRRLLSRHLRTIVTRLDSTYPHLPLLEMPAAAMGQAWARGFALGMAAATHEWDKYLARESIKEFADPILALGLDDDERHAGIRMTPQLRAQVVPLMQVNLLALYTAVRLEEKYKRQPARSHKIGRNEPCPCGSGKKYKRCCGAYDREAIN
jgi:yecA family protein